MTKIPRRPLEIGRLRVQFFVKRTVEQTLTQSLANAFAPLQVSTPEATAFDLVCYAPISRAAETIAPLLPLMRPAELRRVLKIENDQTTTRRLGFVLEKFRATRLAKVVEERLPATSVFVPLVPGSHENAPEVKRWRILSNAGEIGRRLHPSHAGMLLPINQSFCGRASFRSSRICCCAGRWPLCLKIRFCRARLAPAEFPNSSCRLQGRPTVISPFSKSQSRPGTRAASPFRQPL